MNDLRETRQVIPAGLCDDCRHAHIVTTDKGSRFVLCELSKTDPRFSRYPRLPVRECDGFSARSREGAKPPDQFG